jgi:hypothetical protein
VAERRERLSLPTTSPVSGSVPPAERGRRRAAPTALTALVTPDLPLAQGPGARWWRTVLMPLCYWHVPRAGLGRWCGVHQPTIRRWVLG